MKSGHNNPPDDIDDVIDSEEIADNWFAVSRDIFDHPIVGIHGRPYTEFEAWMSMLAMASYEAQKTINKGAVIVLDPGDLMAAHSYLAKRWQWSVDKVRYYLKKLQNEAMITRATNAINTKPNTKRNTNQIQIITICNYRKYQNVDSAEHQANYQPIHHPNTKQIPKPAPSNTPVQHQGKEQNIQDVNSIPHQAPTRKVSQSHQANSQESNKDYNRRNICAVDTAPLFPELQPKEKQPPPEIENKFEEFWQAFPAERKRDKGKCRDLFKRIASGKMPNRRATAADLVAAVKAGCGIDPAYPPMPTTWLNGGRWEDPPRGTAGGSAGAVPTGDGAVGPNGKPWGWWRKYSAAQFEPDFWRRKLDAVKPNGVWPWWELGAAPGDPECIVHPKVVAERGLIDLYRGKLSHE